VIRVRQSDCRRCGGAWLPTGQLWRRGAPAHAHRRAPTDSRHTRRSRLLSTWPSSPGPISASAAGRRICWPLPDADGRPADEGQQPFGSRLPLPGKLGGHGRSPLRSL